MRCIFTVKLWFFIIFWCAVITYMANAKGYLQNKDRCKTPLGEVGKCKSLTDCTYIKKPLDDIILENHPNVQNYLNKSLCGKLQQNNMYCCPDNQKTGRMNFSLLSIDIKDTTVQNVSQNISSVRPKNNTKLSAKVMPNTSSANFENRSMKLKRDQPCVTPLKEVGNCVLLRHCLYIKLPRDKIKLDDQPLVKEYLSKIRCGYENKEELVCCPLHRPTREMNFSILNNQNITKFPITTLQPIIIPRLTNSSNQNNSIKPTIVEKLNIPPNVTNSSDSNIFNSSEPSVIKESAISFKLINSSTPTITTEFPITSTLINSSTFGIFEKPTIPPTPTNSFDSNTSTKPDISPELTNSSKPNVIKESTNTSKWINSSEPKTSTPSLLSSSQPTCSKFVRKTGGKKKPGLDEFPWMALLMFENKTSGINFTTCSGSLIAPRWILTAAHCVTELVDNITLHSVVLGEYNKKNYTDCLSDEDENVLCSDPVVTISIQKIIAHPEASTIYLENDIAMLYLSETVQTSRFIQLICLPNRESNSKRYWSAGWGSIQSNSTASDERHNVELSHVDFEQCANSYNKHQITLEESQMCAGDSRGQDTFDGDSGGALAAVEDDHWVIHGILSFGRAHSTEECLPSVFTKVFHYRSWILNTMKLFS